MLGANALCGSWFTGVCCITRQLDTEERLEYQVCPICGMRVQWLADERVRFCITWGMQHVESSPWFGLFLSLGIDCHWLACDTSNCYQDTGQSRKKSVLLPMQTLNFLNGAKARQVRDLCESSKVT